MKKYIKQLAIAIDQFVNTLCFGYADETISSRVYRLSIKGKQWYYKAPANIVNYLFFWDKVKTDKKIQYHCELSYLYEKERMHFPPEMRKKNEKPLSEN